MTKKSEPKEGETDDTIDIGSVFRSSATITFVIEIVSVIVMLGSVAAFYAGGFLPQLNQDLQILLLLIGSIITLLIFLTAMGVFIRFSRRIGNAVIGRGIEKVRMDTPRIKTVVYTYAILIILMGATSFYIFYLIYKNYLNPWALSYNSISLQVFNWALGAFFIALLIQIIIAVVGRSATKVIIGVLDTDDSEFLE